MFRFHCTLKILLTLTLLTLNASEAFIQQQGAFPFPFPSLSRIIWKHPVTSLKTPQPCLFRLTKMHRGGGTASAAATCRNVYSSSSSSSSSLTRWITGMENSQRPAWARDWMPTGLVQLRPGVQLVVVLLCYIFHMTVLAQRSLSFPIQLIPNERGHFQSIGWDSLAGMATLGAYYYFRQTLSSPSSTTAITSDSSNVNVTVANSEAAYNSSILPKLWSTPKLKEAPWKNIYRSKYSRVTSFLALCALFRAYFWTGRFSLWWEDTFYYLANFYPITVPMHRSLCVLFGHLSWISMGVTILRTIPSPQSFFENTWYTQRYGRRSNSCRPNEMESNHDNDNGNDRGATPQWVWWTVGGYFVSSWLFNVADFVNQLVLPLAVLEQAQESVVSQLINPEMNDWWASVVGYIAPCITAPWWEEVLYRGFLLPALILQMKYKWAIMWSGIIFSVHHLSPTACIPLAILGWTWSILYAKSGNLLTTILVHAMWNSRIFIGSWLGL